MDNFRQEIERQIQEKKMNLKTTVEVLEMVNAATTTAELNKLRVYVTSAMDKEILQLWQKKFRASKICPTCGRSR